MGFSILEWKKSELVYVLTILLVAFGVSAIQLSWGAIKTRDAQRKADSELVARSLEAYYDQHDKFPQSRDGLIVACGSSGEDGCVWGEGRVVDDEGIVYLERLPADPYTYKGWKYVYEANDSLQGFRIYTGLENSNDVNGKANLTVGCGETVQCKWYVEK